MDTERWTRIREVVEAALEEPEGARAAFVEEACAGDPSLLEEVRQLLAEDATRDAWMEPPTRAVLPALLADESGREVGPWKLLREIGAGGMGSVYLAVRADEQFEKQVAVKLLKRGMDTGELLERFMRERQVLAGLEHPGIARLIDGGATEDGLPYIVMEYVEGLPIDRWCDERRLPTDERLALFRKVCDAVRFAHSNLVVHRDLKPSNILVTTDGEPKLLDFGIAKVLDPTQPSITADLTGGLRFMTPEYASPEQVRGRPVTTASDVYSLGAVLYQLLTGHVPHRLTTRSPLEIERAVCEQEPTRPSTAVARVVERASTRVTPEEVSRARLTTPRGLRRALSGDLDTIVMKALRKEAQRRYLSVEQLSEDVRRYLEGLPVIARPDSPGYRLGKFVWRNRVLVGATAAVVLALGAGLWNSDRLYRDASAARGLAVERLAEVQRLAADIDAERELAQRRFDDVRSLAHTVIYDVNDGLTAIAGGTRVQEQVVRAGLVYLDRLAAEAHDDHELQAELAGGYLRIGHVQGGIGTSNLGLTNEARESYGKALAITAALFAEEETREPIRQLHADALRSRAWIDLADARPRETAAGFERALEVSRGGPDPDAPEALEMQRVVYGHLSEVYNTIGDPERVLAFGEAQLEVTRRLVELAPTDEHLLTDSTSRVKYADALKQVGRTAEAEEHVRAAVDQLDQLTRRHPTDTSTLQAAAGARIELGSLLLATRRPAEAAPVLERGLEHARELSLADPDDVLSARTTARTHQRLAQALGQTGRPELALEHHRAGLELYQRVLALDPANWVHRRDVAAGLSNVALGLAVGGRPEEAIPYMEEALPEFEAIVAADPGTPGHGVDIFIACAYLGQMNQDLALRDGLPAAERLAHVQRAQELHVRGLETARELVKRNALLPEHEGLVRALEESLVDCEELEAELAAALTLP